MPDHAKAIESPIKFQKPDELQGRVLATPNTSRKSTNHPRGEILQSIFKESRLHGPGHGRMKDGSRNFFTLGMSPTFLET